MHYHRVTYLTRVFIDVTQNKNQKISTTKCMRFIDQAIQNPHPLCLNYEGILPFW